MIKKYTFFLALLVLCALYSCKKIAGHEVTPSGSTTSGGSTSGSTSGTNTGGSNTQTIDQSKGYSPSVAGTYAKFKNVNLSGSTIDTTINTMSGNTTTINNKLYSVVNIQSTTLGTGTGYYSNINHVYTARTTTTVQGQGLTLELQYLIDNAAVGATWTTPVTDNGTVNGLPAQLVGTITETGITRLVSGFTFSNVIHTTLQLQYNLGAGFSTDATYDYYVAKGVGIVEIDSNVNFPGSPVVNATSKIIDFNIK